MTILPPDLSHEPVKVDGPLRNTLGVSECEDQAPIIGVSVPTGLASWPSELDP